MGAATRTFVERCVISWGSARKGACRADSHWTLRLTRLAVENSLHKTLDGTDVNLGFWIWLDGVKPLKTKNVDEGLGADDGVVAHSPAAWLPSALRSTTKQTRRNRFAARSR